MKNIKWLLLLLLSSTALTAQSTITIKGNIISDLEGHDMIYFNYKGEPLDSVKIINGNFEIVMPFRKGDTPWLHDEYAKKKYGGDRAFNFLFEHPGTITVSNIDIARGFVGTVTGVQSAIDYMEFYNLNDSYTNEIFNELKKKYPVEPEYPSDGNVTPELLNYNNDMLLLYNKYSIIALEKFIKDHPDSYASLYMLNTSAGYINAESLKKNYFLLSPKRQNSEEGKEILKYVDGLKSAIANNKIKDFVLSGPDGKMISSKSLRGKYVLIDFWASWCAPCVAEFPDLKNIYTKYNNKNFEILSISIDKTKEPWLKALNKHELTWLQVIDGKDSQAANFAVSGVPQKFLIDPEGKIIMRDGNIEQKLQDIFGY
ncbi:MAG: hypothetical protein DI539_04060 [Flavobacterium psychrophilum]|nr:MAG: hypothetical protein DI539_04060 [Flavobacterium psychrophilum]